MLFDQQKMGLFQNSKKITIWDKQAPSALPTKKEQEHYFIEKKEEFGRGFLNKSLGQKQEFREMTISH